jgi:hypothetical protein
MLGNTLIRLGYSTVQRVNRCVLDRIFGVNGKDFFALAQCRSGTNRVEWGDRRELGVHGPPRGAVLR